MLPRCINLKRQFHLQHKELYAFADECLEMCGIIQQAVDDLKIKKDKYTKYQRIIAPNFYKALDSYVSVLSLCNDGLVEDAKSITRKLLEIAVSLKYLSLDIDSRLDQYIHFASLSNYKRYSNMKKDDNVQEKDKIYSGGLSEQIRESETKIIEDYENAKQFYKLDVEGEVKEKYFSSWSGKPLKKMAKQCKMQDQIIPYELYCISTHMSIEDYSSFYNNDRKEFGSGFSIGDIPLIIIHSSELYLSVIELCIDAFDLKLKGSFKELEKRLEKFNDRSVFKD